MSAAFKGGFVSPSLRHFMIAIAILAVGAALAYFALADVFCIADACG